MAYINRNNVTSISKREKIVGLWSSGLQQKEIGQQVQLSRKTVTNIIDRFLKTETLLPGKPGEKQRVVSTTPDVVEFVEYAKTTKPSAFTSEIQQGLVDHGVCTPDQVPSRSTISDIIRKDLNFTFKKLSAIPEESLTIENRQKTLQYIMFMSGVDPSRVHFFHESSVVKTTANRTYGHSKRGRPAIEVKRFTSNCNYTVNLLPSRFGVTHFNILLGPSNGLEMLHFFEECLTLVDPVYGNPVIANGDIIVMDNCGFHHGALAENELRAMLGKRC